MIKKGTDRSVSSMSKETALLPQSQLVSRPLVSWILRISQTIATLRYRTSTRTIGLIIHASD